MFADHPVRKQAYLDWNTSILPSRPMAIFEMELTYDSGHKLEFSSFLAFKLINCLFLHKMNL